MGTATAGDAQATVTFTVTATGATLTGYTVTASPGGLTGTGNASPITVTGLTNGTAYTFTVTASYSDSTVIVSNASNSVTPKATQTITFPNPGTQYFGTTLSPTAATASSGLSVGFTATGGVCGVSGITVIYFSTGTCTLQSYQSGNSIYAAASGPT